MEMSWWNGCPCFSCVTVHVWACTDWLSVIGFTCLLSSLWLSFHARTVLKIWLSVWAMFVTCVYFPRRWNVAFVQKLAICAFPTGCRYVWGRAKGITSVCVYLSSPDFFRVGISSSKPVSYSSVSYSLISLHSAVVVGLAKHTSHRKAAYTVYCIQIWGVLVNWMPHCHGIVRPQTALDRAESVALLLRQLFKTACQTVRNAIRFITNNVTKFKPRWPLLELRVVVKSPSQPNSSKLNWVVNWNNKILGKWPTWRTILFYVFISILYMFRATSCSSSGESIVSIQHLVYVTLCRWNKYIERNCASSWSFNKNHNKMHGQQNITFWNNKVPVAASCEKGNKLCMSIKVENFVTSQSYVM